MHVTLAIVIAFLTTFSASADARVQSISKCNNETSIHLQCSSDSLIRIFNVTYGRSDSNSCSYSPEDCSLTEPTSLGCHGKSSCDISIRRDTRYYVKLPKCGVTGNYIEIKYECVKVEEIVDICAEERNDRTSVRGYAAVPTLTTGLYSANLSCSYRIVGANIRLQLITVNLTDTTDCIQIRNTLSSRTFCGGGVVIENTNIALTPSKQIVLSFESDQSGNRGSVWIYYELTLPPTSAPRQTEPPPVLPTTLPDVIINQRGTTTKRTKPEATTAKIISRTSHLGRADEMVQYSASTDSSSTLPQSTLAILGLVFGLFALVIMMLFGVYCYKRYKDRSKKRLRLRTSNGLASNQVAWHNLTNECLADMTKPENMDIHVHNNNAIRKVHNSCADTKNSPGLEHSLC